MQYGVKVYGSDEVQSNIELIYGEKIEGIKRMNRKKLGSFSVIPFRVPHGETDCDGWLLDSPEGKLLFMGYPNNNCIGCVKGGMGYWNKIRVDFPEVFERRAKQEREFGRSCINGVFLDELEPNRGNINTEVMEDCTIACQLLTWGK